MRIVTIEFPPAPEIGLQAIKMENLGSLVVIAGRNGAGKSRLLHSIENRCGQGYESEFNLCRRERELSNAIANNAGRPEHASHTVQLAAELRRVETAIGIRRSYALSIDQRPTIVRFVPKNLGLIDPNDRPPVQTQNAANNINSPGVGQLAEGAFARIQVCQNRWWEATHPLAQISAEAKEAARIEYEHLEELIFKFLNTKLRRSEDGKATLFDLPLGEAGLSDGQKVILQLCLAVHAQGANLRDLILIMDEPENHLHPAALLDLIEVVSQKLVDGQIWIATHSVPLLANLAPSQIWWMETGGISKSGSKPEVVLKGLLGDETRRDRLAAFLDLPFELASNRFAGECLIPPPTVAAAHGDPQMQQIVDSLKELRTQFPTLRVLDYGAGKGRLPAELAEAWTPEELKTLDYVAFDPSTKDAGECQVSISRLTGDSKKRLFHDATELRSRYDEGSFHVVVMCNVLHEILPLAWSDLFGANGKITRSLHPDGFLLLVEVQQLPYGECAHHQGFLVLDTAHLKKLFSIAEADNASFSHVSARDGWLKAHLISRKLIERFSGDSLKAALTDLRDTAKDRICELRSKGSDYRSGRLHGFWVQQFANASLALS